MIKVSKYFSLLYNYNLNKTVDDLFKLRVLYPDKLKKANIDYKLIKKPKCPSKNNDFYECKTCCPNCAFDYNDLIWNYEKKNFGAIKDNTMIEVTHCSTGTTPTEESVSAWFYLASGSNIWINTGKTMAFEDHRDAVLHFLGQEYLNKFNDCKGKHWGCQKHFTDLFNKIKNTTNIDTIQFLHHLDGRYNFQGDTQSPTVEIVSIRSSDELLLTIIDFKHYIMGNFINCDKIKQENCLQCKNNISI